jgi:hypothetical protein
MRDWGTAKSAVPLFESSLQYVNDAGSLMLKGREALLHPENFHPYVVVVVIHQVCISFPEAISGARPPAKLNDRSPF